MNLPELKFGTADIAFPANSPIGVAHLVGGLLQMRRQQTFGRKNSRSNDPCVKVVMRYIYIRHMDIS